MIAKLRTGWTFLLTKLNALGSILLAYALLNPAAANDLLNTLPPKLKIPASLALPAAWFMLVQYSKMKAIKTARLLEKQRADADAHQKAAQVAAAVASQVALQKINR